MYITNGPHKFAQVKEKSLDSHVWSMREGWVVDINILSCTFRQLIGGDGTSVVVGCLILCIPGRFKLDSLPYHSPSVIKNDTESGN